MLSPLLSLALLVVAPAPQTPGLRWKFREGDVFRYRVETKQASKLQKGGPESGSVVVRRFTVKKLNKDGSAEIEARIESFQMKPRQEDTKQLAWLRETGFTITVTPSGEVKGLKGIKAYLAQIPKEQRDSARLYATEQHLSQNFIDLFSRVPHTGEQAADVWERKVTQDLGPMGLYKAASKYRLAGARKGMQRIEWKSNVRMGPPRKEDRQAVLILKKCDLRGEETGKLFFDPVRGRMIESSSTLRLTGSETLTMGENDLDLQIDDVMTTRTTLLSGK
jgi:hypothetical protein